MDWVTMRSRGKELVRKYRYVLLVVLAGLFLMALPDGKNAKAAPEPAATETEPRQDLQTGLEEILSQIQGAGRVRVLLTQREGERTVYQTDEDSTSSGIRSDTVLLNGSDRSQTGLVQQVNPPTYLGAVIVCQGADSASVEIAGYHTNVIRIEKNGVVQFHKDYQESGSQHATDRSLLTVEQIIAFANEVDIADVQETLQQQIDYNWAIAEEGLRGDYGANIGRILLQSYGMSIHNRAKAYAAAGSDARMNGCDLPVVINSGSGNQGLTASLPVIVYAKELGVTQQMLYRALVVSNLVTIHLKTGIGSLSAYCGATAAGCGAAAGVTYLYGGQFREIAHTIVNAIAIDSGMICDGAKASCAAKIASAVEAGLLGMQMQMHESQFYGGDGIVVKGVENTIRNIGTLASEGMRETDRTIIRMMIQEH